MFRQKSTLKLFCGDDPRAFFGTGPFLLLSAIGETHSIAKAAKSMNMAYTKALALIKHAEAALGKPLITAQTGGKGGGGSELTETALALVAAFRTCQTALDKEAETLFQKHFGPIL